MILCKEDTCIDVNASAASAASAVAEANSFAPANINISMVKFVHSNMFIV